MRLVGGSLSAVAGATAILMLVFIWHTSPRRRFRVATRRAERRRAQLVSDEDDMTLDDDVIDQVDGNEADRSEDAEVEESRE